MLSLLAASIGGTIAAQGTACASPGVAELKIWTAPSAQKIFRGDVCPAAPATEAALEAAGGEIEAVQVVLRAEMNECQLTSATLDSFRDARGDAIPEVRAELLQVAYIYLPDLNREMAAELNGQSNRERGNLDFSRNVHARLNGIHLRPEYLFRRTVDALSGGAMREQSSESSISIH